MGYEFKGDRSSLYTDAPVVVVSTIAGTDVRASMRHAGRIQRHADRTGGLFVPRSVFRDTFRGTKLAKRKRHGPAL